MGEYVGLGRTKNPFWTSKKNWIGIEINMVVKGLMQKYWRKNYALQVRYAFKRNEVYADQEGVKPALSSLPISYMVTNNMQWLHVPAVSCSQDSQCGTTYPASAQWGWHSSWWPASANHGDFVKAPPVQPTLCHYRNVTMTKLIDRSTYELNHLIHPKFFAKRNFGLLLERKRWWGTVNASI